MIDWISSKVAMSLAALILLAGVVSFFLAQQEEARHDALQSIANQAAAYIDEVSRSPGEIAARISVGPGGTLELPALAAGEAYALTVYRSYVVAGYDGKRAFAVLVTPIHMWEPRAGNYTASEVAEFDTLHSSLVLKSAGTNTVPGPSAIVSRRSLVIDGGARLETFVFL